MESISENAFDESDFEIKLKAPLDDTATLNGDNFDNKRRIGLRTIPAESVALGEDGKKRVGATAVGGEDGAGRWKYAGMSDAQI